MVLSKWAHKYRYIDVVLIRDLGDTRAINNGARAARKQSKSGKREGVFHTRKKCEGKGKKREGNLESCLSSCLDREGQHEESGDDEESRRDKDWRRVSLRSP